MFNPEFPQSSLPNDKEEGVTEDQADFNFEKPDPAETMSAEELAEKITYFRQQAKRSISHSPDDARMFEEEAEKLMSVLNKLQA